MFWCWFSLLWFCLAGFRQLRLLLLLQVSVDELFGRFFRSDLVVFLEIEPVFVGDNGQGLLLGLSQMLFLL